MYAYLESNIYRFNYYSASLGLMNIISYDVTMPIMIVFMGLTLLTNAKDCYDKGAKK